MDNNEFCEGVPLLLLFIFILNSVLSMRKVNIIDF